MEVLECRGRFPLANNHLSCIWGLSRLDNSFSKSRAVKPPAGLMWQKKTRTAPACSSVQRCTASIWNREGKRVLSENPIRERRKQALQRERERAHRFFPEIKYFRINRKILYHFDLFQKTSVSGYLLRKQTLQGNRELFPPQVQFKP